MSSRPIVIWTYALLFIRLEEEDKFLNAESYYKKALNIDKTFQEAEDALVKLRKQMQVILYFLLVNAGKWHLLCSLF